LIIGQAARQVSNETRQRYPNIPWSDIIAMRNHLIHEYIRVDMEVVWNTIKNDLPPLIAELEQVMQRID